MTDHPTTTFSELELGLTALPGSLTMTDGRLITVTEEVSGPGYERRARVSTANQNTGSRWVEVDAPPFEVSTHTLRQGIKATLDNGGLVQLSRNGCRLRSTRREVAVTGSGIDWACVGRPFGSQIVDRHSGDWLCRYRLIRHEVRNSLSDVETSLLTALIVHHVPQVSESSLLELAAVSCPLGP